MEGCEMPKLLIERRHGKQSTEEVRKCVQDLAGKLKEKYQLDYTWRGNTLEFKRSGADGRIEMDGETVRLVMNISLVLTPIKGEIEKRTARYMDEYFGPAPSR